MSNVYVSNLVCRYVDTFLILGLGDKRPIFYSKDNIIPLIPYNYMMEHNKI